MTKQITGLRKRLVELDFSIRSCKDRVRDLEWEIEMSEPGSEDADLLNQRRRTLDKLRHLYAEMESVQKELIDLGVEK